MIDNLYPLNQLAYQLASQICNKLATGSKPILIITAGGSALTAVAQALTQIRGLASSELARITITLLDERWQPNADHPKSNWQSLSNNYRQLASTELSTLGINLKPMYTEGQTLSQAAAEFDQWFQSQIETCELFLIIGIGADGHLAGILPHPATVTIFDTAKVVGYALTAENISMQNPHLEPGIAFRITPGFELCAELIRRSEFVAIYAAGATKLVPLQKLLSAEQLDQKEFPSVIVRKWLEKIKIFTDQL
jgi:6-phosphogluconolactonase/glucosamine-6-phosphate isomerase/deaminase